MSIGLLLVPIDRLDALLYTWELAGQLSGILSDPVVGESARTIVYDAQTNIKAIFNEKAIKAHGVIGFFPANSIEDDIELYTDEHAKY